MAGIFPRIGVCSRGSAQRNIMQLSFINLAQELFPLNRSLTGDGVRKTLEIIGRIVPVNMLSYPTGALVGDWKIPREWRVRCAYLEDPKGHRRPQSRH